MHETRNGLAPGKGGLSVLSGKNTLPLLLSLSLFTFVSLPGAWMGGRRERR